MRGNPDLDFDPEHPNGFMLEFATDPEVDSLASENAGDHPIYWRLLKVFRGQA